MSSESTANNLEYSSREEQRIVEEVQVISLGVAEEFSKATSRDSDVETMRLSSCPYQYIMYRVYRESVFIC